MTCQSYATRDSLWRFGGFPPPEAFFEQVTQLLGQAFKGAEDVQMDPPLRSGEGHWMIRIEWGNQPWGNAYLARSVF